MPILIVVEKPDDWPLDVPGVSVVPARRYLTDPDYSGGRGVKVFNLCRRYRYQSLGYYVSLLAAARGHRPLPSVATIQDLRHRTRLRLLSDDLDAEIQRSLRPIAGDEFTLSVYFGRNLAHRHQRLATKLFNQFPVPLLRAVFGRNGAHGDGAWRLESLRPIAAREIPPHHRDFVVAAAREHFARRRPAGSRTAGGRFDLAILVDQADPEPPSNRKAIRRFLRAAREVGFNAELIGHEDYGRLAEFDALFLRWTTAVDHPTYRFARRAANEGLVVIDDPASIVRCTNKVFLAEALARAKIPTPATRIVEHETLEQAAREMTYPCILKRPDSFFSKGVERVDDREAFLATARRFLEDSELLIAQEFLPTEFDWRVGVLAGQVLFAARYHMAAGHWQIVRRDDRGKVAHYGNVCAVPLDEVPRRVLEYAAAAARLMGDGFYGVDLKQRGDDCWVIEVNDSPNVDAGYEDTVLGEALYRRVMEVFMERVERRKAPEAAR
jgi:glutathione synthase/RimK-type ligase-like ATP-grasp enzyme